MCISGRGWHLGEPAFYSDWQLFKPFYLQKNNPGTISYLQLRYGMYQK